MNINAVPHQKHHELLAVHQGDGGIDKKETGFPRSASTYKAYREKLICPLPENYSTP
jgi:hypothetical protein